jgi:hypothetical protein
VLASPPTICANAGIAASCQDESISDLTSESVLVQWIERYRRRIVISWCLSRRRGRRAKAAVLRARNGRRTCVVRERRFHDGVSPYLLSLAAVGQISRWDRDRSSTASGFGSPYPIVV